MENIKALIEKYNITPVGLHTVAPQLRINNIPKSKAAQAQLVSMIKPLKADILDYFRQEEANRAAQAEQERQRLAQILPGLNELRTCKTKWEDFREEINRRFDSPEGLISYPEKPNTTYADLAAQYPAAAAYLKAEQYSLADNDRKASAGRTALKEIAAGGNYQDAIAQMERWADDISIWN